MKPFEKIKELRAKAISDLEEYTETLEDNLCRDYQPIVETLVRQLQVRYPKRNIHMCFGNGIYVVNFDGHSDQYSSYLDYGSNLMGWYDYSQSGVKTLRSFEEDHPLVQLMKVLDELYDLRGFVPLLEAII